MSVIELTPKAAFLRGYKAALQDAVRNSNLSGRYLDKRIEMEWGNYVARQRERSLMLERSKR